MPKGYIKHNIVLLLILNLLLMPKLYIYKYTNFIVFIYNDGNTLYYMYGKIRIYLVAFNVQSHILS